MANNKFVAEAVRREVERRRRRELRRSLQNPLTENPALADQGFQDWVQSLPQEDAEALVDSRAGRPVRWVSERDGCRGASEARSRLYCRRGLGSHCRPGTEACGLASSSADPDVIRDQRLPIVLRGAGNGDKRRRSALSALTPSRSGPAKHSFALIDHLRSIDKRRIQRVFGELRREEIAAIDEGLAAYLGLSNRLDAGNTSPIQ